MFQTAVRAATNGKMIYVCYHKNRVPQILISMARSAWRGKFVPQITFGRKIDVFCQSHNVSTDIGGTVTDVLLQPSFASLATS